MLFDSCPNLRPFLTVGQVLADLPDVTTPEAANYLNHTARIHRAGTVDYMKTVPQGVSVRKSYRYRAPWNGQCRSLTAGLDDSAKAYIHPTYHREMTVREYARIHGFPDTWAFAGKLDNGLKQVANSVPIPLGSAILFQMVNVILGGGYE
jgi:DNA (cytosine-5)-methyltransferase 1